MNYVKKENMCFRFAPMGTVAPEKIPANEIWLDVGNRAAPQVLDHHAGDTEAWSASQLVLENYREFILDPLAEQNDVTIVLHASPDLDAICSAWLVEMILTRQIFQEHREHVAKIVKAVSENDQGLVRTDGPETCWPVVMRILIGTEFAGRSDEEKLTAGMEVLEQSLDLLRKDKTLDDAARHIITPSVRSVIAQAERDYLEDLSRAVFFQIRLPVRPFISRPISGMNASLSPSEPPEGRWSITDAIYLDDPASWLFKELARHDKKHSPMKQGFPLLIVSRDLNVNADRPVQRYIISTDPLSGLHLQGLGKFLESFEQKKEEDEAKALFSGRERVEQGEGRHGYNVVSPWYDGRGHNFTIVDSPSVEIDGKGVCASSLTSGEILEVLWHYGDPSRFINVFQTELFIISSASLQPGWETEWPEKILVSNLCPELCQEVEYSLTNLGMAYFYSKSDMQDNKLQPVENVKMLKQYLMPLSHETALWIGKFEFNSNVKDVRNLSQKLYDLRRSSLQLFTANSIVIDSSDESLHVLHFRTKPADLSLEERTGHSAQALFLLSAAESPCFSNRASSDKLASAETVKSPDLDSLMCASRDGIAIVTTKNTPLGEETLGAMTVISLAMALKISLCHISKNFSIHRAGKNPVKAGELVLSDRLEVVRLEQELSFSKVTDWRFGQKIYDAVLNVLDVQALLKDTRGKIESLAEHVRDSRSDFYEKIMLWVSVLFAPLAITASFFSGTHMQKGFSRAHFTFLSPHLQPAGWLQFAIVFLCLSFSLGLLWLFIKLGYNRKNPLRWLKKKQKKIRRT